MLNGSALLSFLGSGFIYIFRANRLYESKDISMNTMSLSVDVRRSKMPLSESGKEEYKANPVFWLATQESKMGPSWPPGISRVGPARKTFRCGRMIIHWPNFVTVLLVFILDDLNVGDN